MRRGALPGSQGEVVVDRSLGSAPGEEVVIGEAAYLVTGTTSGTTMFAGMPLVFMDIRDAQDLVYRGQPLAAAVLVDAEPTALPPGFVLRTPDEIAEDAIRPLDGAISSVNLVRILLWFVVAMIIGTMVYLTALERSRDVAVLKAVGGSTAQLGSSIGLQGVLSALGAALLAAGLQALLVPVFPVDATVPARAFYQVPLIAVLVALASGAVGLRRAVRTDPALAFAGPGS